MPKPEVPPDAQPVSDQDGPPKRHKDNTALVIKNLEKIQAISRAATEASGAWGDKIAPSDTPTPQPLPIANDRADWLEYEDLYTATTALEHLVLEIDYAKILVNRYGNHLNIEQADLVDRPREQYREIVKTYLEENREHIILRRKYCPNCHRHYFVNIGEFCPKHGCDHRLEDIVLDCEEELLLEWARFEIVERGLYYEAFVCDFFTERWETKQTWSTKEVLQRLSDMMSGNKQTLEFHHEGIHQFTHPLMDAISGRATLIPMGKTIGEEYADYITTRNRIVTCYNAVSGAGRRSVVAEEAGEVFRPKTFPAPIPEAVSVAALQDAAPEAGPGDGEEDAAAGGQSVATKDKNHPLGELSWKSKGSRYEITFADETANVKNSLRSKQMEEILRQRGNNVDVWRLDKIEKGEPSNPDDPQEREKDLDNFETVLAKNSTGEVETVADPKAMQQLYKRLHELKDRRERPESEEEGKEIDDEVEMINAEYLYKGKPKLGKSESQKAKDRVRTNINAFLTDIENQNTALHKHLNQYVTRSNTFIYEPPADTPEWEF